MQVPFEVAVSEHIFPETMHAAQSFLAPAISGDWAMAAIAAIGFPDSSNPLDFLCLAYVVLILAAELIAAIGLPACSIPLDFLRLAFVVLILAAKLVYLGSPK
jgi:hypothetical protein